MVFGIVVVLPWSFPGLPRPDNRSDDDTHDGDIVGLRIHANGLVLRIGAHRLKFHRVLVDAFVAFQRHLLPDPRGVRRGVRRSYTVHRTCGGGRERSSGGNRHVIRGAADGSTTCRAGSRHVSTWMSAIVEASDRRAGLIRTMIRG